MKKTLRFLRIAHVGYVVVEYEEGTQQAVTKVVEMAAILKKYPSLLNGKKI